MVIEYGDKKIKFCNNILQVIQKYVQSERKSCEAGGILIGRENCGNSNLIIEFITEPMTADQRSRNRFLRKDKKTSRFFKKLYEENEGVYGYMGEWHTHPENIPQYSFIDSNNWKKIGKEMKVAFNITLLLEFRKWVFGNIMLFKRESLKYVV